MKIGCDELMMHTINPKTTTKIAKQRIINHMPLKDRKMGVKIQIIRKQEKNKVKIKDMGKNRTDCKGNQLEKEKSKLFKFWKKV